MKMKQISFYVLMIVTHCLVQMISTQAFAGASAVPRISDAMNPSHLSVQHASRIFSNEQEIRILVPGTFGA